jgi:hypothetical protein
VQVDAGAVLELTEVVRATLDYPAVWTVRAFLDRGVGPVAVEAHLTCGVGGVFGTEVLALGVNGTVVRTHVPATELVVSARCPVAGAAYRVVVQAAPISSWDPWASKGNMR